MRCPVANTPKTKSLSFERLEADRDMLRTVLARIESGQIHALYAVQEYVKEALRLSKGEITAREFMR